MMFQFRRILTVIPLLLLVCRFYTAAQEVDIQPAAAINGETYTLRFVVDSVRPMPYCEQSLPTLRKPKLALVLSGGGARGLAQVGVLKALEEEGIRPDLIIGTSVGSIVGGLYAAGYKATRLEQVLRAMDWKTLLQLSDEADRSILIVDQKPISDRSILTLRLDGLQPRLPLAASNGQRLMNALNELVIQGIYHSSDFDSLGIPFRAVPTDLHSGSRVGLRNGNLAEAMRASSAIPVMYNPVLRDGMLLADGGLLSNIPSDVAREEECDIVLAVNTTSPLRTPNQLTDALETLDQVITIMMRQQVQNLSRLADVVITPKLGDLLASDFSAIDTLIAIGYAAGKAAAPALRKLITARILHARAPGDLGDTTQRRTIASTLSSEDIGDVPTHTVNESAHSALGMLWDGRVASVRLHASGAGAAAITRFETEPLSRISGVRFHGVTLLTEAAIAGIEGRWKGQALTADNTRDLCEYAIEEYRLRGFSLAHVIGMEIDRETGMIDLTMVEGRIHEIRVTGNDRTNTVVIRREIPLKEGEIFRISALEQGMKNLSALPLFQSVSYDIDHVRDDPVLTIRVVERASQFFQAGLLVNNERNAQVGVVLRDASFLGSGTELRASFFSGTKNRRYALEYRTNRMFYTPFSFTAEGYWGFKDYNSYEDVTGLPRNRFERDVASVYRATGYGAATMFGLYVQRFGKLLGTLRYEQQSIRTTEFKTLGVEALAENHALVSLELSATVDTQDKYPFPSKGILFFGEYTSAQTALGGDVAFSRLLTMYELYIPIYKNEIIFHPRFEFGYGDKTMPRFEEFRLGGLARFIGMRENEFNGRQIVLGSAELRYRLPFDILFDTYLSLRYDIGRTWANPELIRISELRHGAGLVIGLDTPIGPANFGIGRSFFFVRNNPETLVRLGPTNLYFSIGVELD